MKGNHVTYGKREGGGCQAALRMRGAVSGGREPREPLSAVPRGQHPKEGLGASQKAAPSTSSPAPEGSLGEGWENCQAGPSPGPGR